MTSDPAHIAETELDAALKLWAQEVFALLLAEGKINDEVVANIRSWKHSGFSVDQSVRLDAGEAIEPEEQLRDIRDKGTKGQRDKGTKD